MYSIMYDGTSDFLKNSHRNSRYFGGVCDCHILTGFGSPKTRLLPLHDRIGIGETRITVAQLHTKRQLLQLDREIDRHQLHTGGKFQYRRGEVENPLHARFDQSIRHTLSRFRRNGNDRQIDPIVPNEFAQIRQIADRLSFDQLTDLFRIGIDQTDDLEAVGTKSLISQQRTSEVADPHQCSAPDSIDAEHTTNFRDQIAGGITDPALTQITQLRQILADLCIGDAEGFGEIAAGEFDTAFAVP